MYRTSHFHAGRQDYFVRPKNTRAKPRHSEQVSNCTHLASLAKAQNLECRGHHHALLFVVGRRDALKGLQAIHGLLAASCLVGQHACHHNSTQVLHL